jgi:outer membrane protein insertion porin family
VFDTHLSLNVGVHRRQLVYPLFTSNSSGAGAGLVAPLGAGLRGSLEYALDLVDAVPGDSLAGFADSARFPQGALRSALTLRLSHDTRRSAAARTLGAYHALAVATGGWWTLGEISFVELRGTARYYVPLILGALLKINLSVANIAEPTGKPVVVSERYFAGGFGSVRGYWPRSLGPTEQLGDPTDPAAPAKTVQLGGVREVLTNAEVEIPIIKEWDLKGFVFVDAGNTFDERETWFLIGHWQDGREVPLPLGLYSSVGFGALIPTGTLPIRLEWSVPLTRRPGDRDIDFFFGVGGFF